ncbi:hypothetical protein PGB90_009870 [Kerria lacca]
MDINSNLIHRAALEFVHFINVYNSKYSKLCEKLNLKEIHEAAKLLPNKKVLSFKGSYDADGWVPDLSQKIRVTSEVFQVKVATEPGAGIYEFSTIYDILSDHFTFQINDVSRTNKYGDDSKCIKATQEQLRKFCFCKKG